MYDGYGNLVKKIKPDGSRTIYIGNVYEVDKTSGGAVTRTVTYYPAGGAMRIDGTVYYVLKDRLGSAYATTDALGNVVGEMRYYAFGETRLSTGNMFTDRLFTGQRQIAELGVYHYNARFYSPTLGRFLSADTVMSGFANPQNLNRFSYTANNPVRYTDPTGRCWIELSSHMVWFSDSDPKCGGAPAPTYTPTNTPSDDSDSDAPGDASNSTIRIGFGDYDETGAPVGGWGLGTVAGNNYTIITAEHVYVPGPYMWYQLGDHGQYTYQIDASTVNFDTSQPGDILVITLPQGLPNSFVPAQVGQNTFFGGEDVTVAYEDASDKLHVLDTEVQAFPFLVSPLDNTLIVPVDNPNWILDKGDSGGGVFYNGYLVGVNSIIDSQFNSPYMAFQPLK